MIHKSQLLLLMMLENMFGIILGANGKRKGQTYVSFCFLETIQSCFPNEQFGRETNEVNELKNEYLQKI